MFRTAMHLSTMCSVLALCAAVSAQPGPVYVDDDSTCTENCGGTWATAFDELWEGMEHAKSTGAQEVWVAAGTYEGNGGPIRLENNLKVYGGFAGDETAASQSDPVANPTYITGNRTHRVLRSVDNDATAMLRGFVITKGRVGLANNPYDGAALYLKDSNAVFVNCVFTANQADLLGGAVNMEWNCSPTFVNCAFVHNDGAYGAGAFYIRRWNDTPTFINCTFLRNYAAEAGAILNAGYPTFINCTFADNVATVGSAGALHDNRGRAVLRNCIVWNNSAAREGDAFWNDPLSPQTTVTHSVVQPDEPYAPNVYPGTGNTDEDPLFVYPADDNYQVRRASGARERGDVSILPPDTHDLDWDGDTQEPIPLDLAGLPRIYGSGLDSGAYECDERPFYSGMIRKNRYITVIPDDPGSDMALRVTLEKSTLFPAKEDHQWWVSTPFDVNDAGSTVWIARLGCAPKFTDWTGIDAVHIGDPEIVPSAGYAVEAAALGSDICPPSFSAPIKTFTVAVWGDVAGPWTKEWEATQWWPLPAGWTKWWQPDGEVNDTDTDAALAKFLNHTGAPPLVWCDVDPNMPNVSVDTMDIVRIQDAKTDPTYPFGGPVDCPCTNDCCYGRCCNTFFGTCSNTVQSQCTGFGKSWTQGLACESDPCPGGGGE